jgi:hypothetical protein
MANVKVNWLLPTTRESGKELLISDIDYVELSISADLGANYTLYDRYKPDVLETVVNELEPGTWYFSGVVVDLTGKRSKATEASIPILDSTPPGTLLSLTLSL